MVFCPGGDLIRPVDLFQQHDTGHVVREGHGGHGQPQSGLPLQGFVHSEGAADEKDDMTKIRDNTYRINASCKLDDINSELGTKLYSQDNDSLGGFISEKLDRIPKAGDKLTIDNVWLFVERSSVNRAESVILKIQTDNKDTNDR